MTEEQRAHIRRLKYEHRCRLKFRNRGYVRALRETSKCVDCGSNDHIEFDHLPGFRKIMDISTLVSKNCSWPKLKAELAKCATRCRPCHRRITRERRMALAA